MSFAADRNLLFAILAYQNHFVSHEALISSMNAWVLAKDKSIGQILIEKGHISQEIHDLIEPMVRHYVAANGGDPAAGLQAVAGANIVARELAGIDDPEVRQSLEKVAPTFTPVKEGFKFSEEATGSGDAGADDNSGRKKMPEGGWKAGRFRVFGKLDGGGMGQIFEAWDYEELGRRVAVKMVRDETLIYPEASRLRQARLRKEGEINGNLEHPNIMPVYGMGTTDDGKPYFVMRYVHPKFNLRDAMVNFHADRDLFYVKPESDSTIIETPAASPADPAVEPLPGNEPAAEDEAVEIAEPAELAADESAAPRVVVVPDDIGDETQRLPAMRYDRLTSEQNVDFRKLLKRFVDICNAIDFAHSRRVLHRDLKPENVLLGQRGETLVADWGLAKTKADIQAELRGEQPPETLDVQADPWLRRTAAGDVFGTPGYMSPEQLEGDIKKINEKTDIFSLGAILFEILTCEKPFLTDEIRSIKRQDDRLEALADAIKAGPGDPRLINRSVPKPLAAICVKALAAKPARRYKSAAALARDVENWLADEPLEAYHENALERLKRWVRKNRGKAAAAAASLVIGSVGLSAFAWQRATAEVRVAEAERETALEKQRAEAEKRIGDLKTALETAKTRGAWRDVIDATTKLESLLEGDKSADLLALRLDRLEALDDGSQSKPARELANQLAAELKARPDNFDSRSRGRLFTRMGELFREDFRPGEPSYFDKALKEDLPIAERAYLTALNEPDPKKAIALLEESLRGDPFNTRAIYMVTLLKTWIGEARDSMQRLELAKAVMTDNDTVFLLSSFLSTSFEGKPMTPGDKDRMIRAFGPQFSQAWIEFSDTLVNPGRFAAGSMINLLRAWLSAYPRGAENKSNPLDFITRNPPAAFDTLSKFLGNLLNSPEIFIGDDQTGKLLAIPLNMTLGAFRRQIGVPDKNAQVRLADYREILKSNPTYETVLTAANEMYRAGQIDESFEIVGNAPAKSIVGERYDISFVRLNFAVGQLLDMGMKRTARGLPFIGPDGPVNDAVRRSGRKILNDFLNEKKVVDDFHCEVVSTLAAMIEANDLGSLILSIQSRLRPTPRKVELMLFHKAMLDPRVAADYLTEAGVTKGDAWSWLWMHMHRKHPEITRNEPKLNTMPVNPFMPLSVENPFPPTIPLSTDLK